MGPLVGHVGVLMLLLAPGRVLMLLFVGHIGVLMLLLAPGRRFGRTISPSATEEELPAAPSPAQ